MTQTNNEQHALEESGMSGVTRQQKEGVLCDVPDDMQNNLSERVLCNVVKQHTECSWSCVVRRDQIKCKMPKKEACCVT